MDFSGKISSEVSSSFAAWEKSERKSLPAPDSLSLSPEEEEENDEENPAVEEEDDEDEGAWGCCGW